MQSLIIILQILDTLSLVLELFWLFLACREILWHQQNPLRAAFLYAIRPLAHGLKRCGLGPSDIKIKAKAPPLVLHLPTNALHNFAYRMIMRNIDFLPRSDRAAFAPFLRGNRFARLVDCLVEGNSSPILARYGIRLDAGALERAAYIVSLPEVVVTPPDDGDRKAMRGERGGRRLRVEEGRLAPPKRVSRAGKQARDQRKEQRRRESAEKVRAEAEAEVRRFLESMVSMRAGGVQ